MVQVEGDTDEELLVNEYILEEQEDFKTVLNNVRKIVKLFKKSTVKTCLLQKLNLMLNSPTSWNSIVPMIERSLLLKSCIKKALIDLNSQINLKENEIEMMQELLNILKPMQMAVEALSARDCNLVTVEGVMQFLFNSIKVLPGTKCLRGPTEKIIRKAIKRFNFACYVSPKFRKFKI